MEREQILEAVTRSGLGHLRDALASVLSPSIRVTTRGLDEGVSLPVGRSRFGGVPDLPPGTEWPTVDSIPLAFVGQIDLRDVASFEAAAVLPKRGLLSFFFDSMLTGYEGGRAADRSRVLYTDSATTKLVRREPPESVPERFDTFPEAEPRFEADWTMPELEEIDGDDYPTVPSLVPILATSNDREIYAGLRRELRGEFIGSKLSGCPDAVQSGEIRLAAVLRHDKADRYRYDAEEYQYANSEELVRKMKDLHLLLQAASGHGETWGGAGVVYFWVDREDLAAMRFDRCFALLETT